MMHFRVLSLLGFTCLFASSVFGQKKDDTLDLSTPYHAIYNHLYYTQSDNRLLNVAGKSLHLPSKISSKDADRLTIQLKQILDGKGMFIILEDLPRDPNYVDSISKKSIYTLSSREPDIFVQKIGDKWQYGKTTIKAIPKLHKEVYPFAMHRVVNMVPASWHYKILGLEIWQYLGILFIILVVLILHRLITWILRLLIAKGLSRLKKGFRTATAKAIRKVARPLSWAFLTVLVAGMVPMLQFSPLLNKYLVLLFQVLTPLFLTIVFYNLVGLLSDLFESLASKTESTLDDQLVPLVRRGLRLVVIMVGVIYILYGLNIDPIPYLAGLSIGGIAVALAAQDSVRNVIGSFMIFVDRPFQIGDWINYDGLDGTVEEVGFRTTRMRTFYNSVVSIPNGKLADSKVDNYGLRAYRRYSTKLTITYDTPTEKIDLFVEGLREIVESHPDTRKDYYEVYLNDLGSHSIDIIFYIFFEVPTWSQELKARHDVLKGVIELADALQIRFAFPTQTLHIEDFPEKQSLTPTAEVNPSENQEKLQAYLKKFKERLG